MNADVSVRLAWPDDAEAIVAVQDQLWQEQFADLAEAVIADESARTERLEQWHRLITRPPDARVRVLVALERATIRGFVLVHPCHDGDADQIADGEIGEMAVPAIHRRQGHGSRLLHAAVDTLRADTFTRAVYWLATDHDDLRTFLTETGWEADGSHRTLEADDGTPLKQIRMHTSLVE